MEERARVEGAGAYVGEGVEVLAEFEEAGLGIRVGGAPVERSMSVTGARRKVLGCFPSWKMASSLPFRTSNAAKEDSVSFFRFLKDGVCNWSAVLVDRAAACQVVCNVELCARGILDNL